MLVKMCNSNRYQIMVVLTNGCFLYFDGILPNNKQESNRRFHVFFNGILKCLRGIITSIKKQSTETSHLFENTFFFC